MKRRVVVTGGAGFIGSHLVDNLLGDGYHVTVFDAFGRRGSEYNAAWLGERHPHDRLTVVRGDVRDAEHVHSVVRHADVIYHVAGQVAVTLSVDDPRADFETNALGTFNVLEGARRSGRRPAVIFTSTNKVYGGMDDVATIEEERRYRYRDLPYGIAESQPVDFHSPYGCSKGAADQYVRDYGPIYGLPIIWLWSHVFWRWMSPILRRASQAAAAFSAGLGENLAGIRVVKAFGQEAVMAGKFQRSNSQLLRWNAELHRTRAVLMATTALLTNVGILALWWWGGSRVVRGDVTLGTLLAFYGYASLFYGPLQWFGQLTSWMTQAIVGAQRIFEVLDRPSEPYEEAGAQRLRQVAGRVAFRGVSFGYEAGKPALQEVDFEVAPGEVVGVVGRSGSGKTTAMQLLCRFYEVGAGAIEVDGVDIRRIRLADLRAQIGMVLQEPFLFSGTIAENIGYGRPGAGFEEIVRAAKAAAAHEFIVRKADGYDTGVGNGGSGCRGESGSGSRSRGRCCGTRRF